MIRTVFTANKNTFTLSLPDNYVGKEVEVIVFLLDEGKEMAHNTKKEVTFNAVKLDTRGYKFNRDEANER